MGLQSNLFIKVFIAFWLVTIATLGSWLVTTDYFESQLPRPGSNRGNPPGQPHRVMLRMIYNLENMNDRSLARTVENVAEKHDIQAYLIDREGADLLGREVPDRVTRMALRLQRERRRPFINSPREHLAAYRIRRPDEGLMTAVFVYPEKRAVILDTLSDSLWLRVGLAILISGLVCFGLSRLITNRIRDLQVASRRLADGELDTRLRVREKGGDETDELARDFNTMAGQLQERIQAQKRLLGDVSHELRSPLARLRLSLALAQEKPAQREEYMQRIERETERLEELIEQLLTSRSQGLILDTPVDLTELLTEVCADTSFEGQGEGKRCSFTTEPQRAPVLSHSDLLRKGFENILRNSLHHTAQNTTVEVALATVDGHYEVSVTDRGPGVPEEDLAKIFNEFYRSDTARTRESGGFGLGLAIARRAIQQHGGAIVAENTGSGLRIIVRLPATGDPLPR
jgi:two-component system sensor histidine kinase CpxA